MAMKKMTTSEIISYTNSWVLTPPYRGDLPNMPKHEFADLIFKYMDEAEKLDDRQYLVIDLEDGRRLEYCLHIFPKTEHDPELREWCVELKTIDQRTPRCVLKWKERKAWVYLAPYRGEGYRVKGKWSYKVWW